MTNYAWITTSFEGFHSYSNAPKEVSFLRNEHRHIFHVKVFIEVFHNDRDIEFILFKEKINRIIDFIKCTKYSLGSCEMISDDIYNILKDIYPNRKVKIEVSEDLENGCSKEYE